MKRLLILFITMAMTVGGAVTVEAKQSVRSERTLRGSYRPYPSPVTGCNEALGSWACMIVQPRLSERFVSVKVTDTHGLPVYFSILHPRTGFWAEFCGETTRPVAFPAGGDLEIEVGVSRMVTQTACPASSVKTTGTITVKLSNQR